MKMEVVVKGDYNIRSETLGDGSLKLIIEAEEFANVPSHASSLKMAADPSTPVEVLDKLARNEHTDVRETVAMNESTSVVTLKMLAVDEEACVRRAVVENEKLPIEYLRKLKSDRSRFVRKVASRKWVAYLGVYPD